MLRSPWARVAGLPARWACGKNINKNFEVPPCSLGLSATGQQYFSLRTNQPAVLFSQNKSAPAISHQPNEEAVQLVDRTGHPQTGPVLSLPDRTSRTPTSRSPAVCLILSLPGMSESGDYHSLEVQPFPGPGQDQNSKHVFGCTRTNKATNQCSSRKSEFHNTNTNTSY
jgi:hypothetical protein